MNKTECRNKNSIGIDKKNSLQIVKVINKEDKKVIKAVKQALPEISKAIDICYEALLNNGRVIYIGAGTSGRLGVLDASEMPPTFGVDNNQIVGLIAGGDDALRNPIEGAEDDPKAILVDLKKIKFTKKDVLLGASASGGAPYVISGLKYAKKLGSKTISLSTNKNTKIGSIVDVAIEPDVGPEIITGSTRMKSGTAQKLVFNMISTGAMIKLGKVYDNLMIDVSASNIKLKKRAIGIVKEFVKDKEEKEIENILIETKYNVKKSIVMLKYDMKLNEIKKYFNDDKKSLRNILEDIQNG